jgi:hypothetical protein
MRKVSLNSGPEEDLFPCLGKQVMMPSCGQSPTISGLTAPSGKTKWTGEFPDAKHRGLNLLGCQQRQR